MLILAVRGEVVNVHCGLEKKWQRGPAGAAVGWNLRSPASCVLFAAPDVLCGL